MNTRQRKNKNHTGLTNFNPKEKFEPQRIQQNQTKCKHTVKSMDDDKFW